MATIVISGNGEIGSAVAGALYRAGHRVVVQHDPGGSMPPADRRELGGVLAKRARRLEDLARMVGCGRAIAEATEPLQRVIDTVRPQMVLDVKSFGNAEPQRIAETVLQEIAAKGLRAEAWTGQNADGAAKSLGTGALIGYLGGLIGLGGAEFRLPALVGWFGLRLRTAIAANLVVSLATVVSALIARASLQEAGALSEFAWPVISLALGSIAGAYVGASIAARVERKTLHRVVGGLLGALALLIAVHGALPSSGEALVAGGLGVVAGMLCGLLIGVVSSLLGVAGGELLIPTFVLLFGAELKLAGTLSLAVSIPTLLVALWRLKGTPAMEEAVQHRSLLLWMGIGSVLGALLGSASFGLVPTGILSLLLAAILTVSAVKLYRG